MTTTLDIGWHENVPMEDYLAIPAMSASGMEHFLRSPAHYRHAMDNPKEPTDAMREGTALHLALLEPHLFEGRYISLGQCEATKKGDGQRCTNQGIVYRDGKSYCGVKGHDPEAGEPMAAGIEVMSADALERIEGMRRAVMEHSEASQYFRGKGASELTGIARDPETGVLLKIRVDRSVDRADWIHVDLKSTGDASPDAFTRQVGRMAYARKAQFYRRTMRLLDREVTASVLVAVEHQPPHGVGAYLLDEGDLAGFNLEIDRGLRSYAECLASDTWPAYPAGLRPLKLLPWDQPHVEEEELAA